LQRTLAEPTEVRAHFAAIHFLKGLAVYNYHIRIGRRRILVVASGATLGLLHVGVRGVVEHDDLGNSKALGVLEGPVIGLAKTINDNERIPLVINRLYITTFRSGSTDSTKLAQSLTMSL